MKVTYTAAEFKASNKLGIRIFKKIPNSTIRAKELFAMSEEAQFVVIQKEMEKNGWFFNEDGSVSKEIPEEQTLAALNIINEYFDRLFDLGTSMYFLGRSFFGALKEMGEKFKVTFNAFDKKPE